MPTFRGKSCMVDSIIEPPSRAWVVTARSVLGPSPPGPGSAPVVHARVTHRQHRRLLVELEATIDDLAEEQRVATDLDGLAHLAVEERDRLVEDRRAGGAVVEREPVERARVEVDLDRLRELAHDGAIVLR